MMHKPIQLKDLSLSFPQKICFKNFTSLIHYGDRIGLIGQNGCGKSTFLKALQGGDSPVDGELILPEDVLIGYLPQLIDTDQSLSGSERLHKILTQALTLRPNVLLLDEPTNHLDQRNRKSLMRLLHSFPGTLIIASHDVALLTHCVDKVWHIDQGKIRVFCGNYQDYCQEMEQARARVENEFLLLNREKKAAHHALMNEQQRAKKSKSMGEKNIAQGKWPTITSAAKAQRAQETSGRKKRSIDLKKQDLTEKLSELYNPETIKPKFSLTTIPRHNKTVVSIHNGEIGYHHFLLKNINFSLTSDERMTIEGENGCGKSTLIKGILGSPTVIKKGEWFAPSPQDIGYLDQHYRNLDPHKTVFETLQELMPGWTPAQIRRHLNDFLFCKNEAINVKTTHLSGGEKARLSLCQIAAKTPKLLILDEITNNLDLETKEHVRKVLQEYPGALIIISHEPDFLKAINITHTVNVTQFLK